MNDCFLSFLDAFLLGIKSSYKTWTFYFFSNWIYNNFELMDGFVEYEFAP